MRYDTRADVGHWIAWAVRYHVYRKGKCVSIPAWSVLRVWPHWRVVIRGNSLFMTIYIIINGQTVLLYCNSSVWLDMRDFRDGIETRLALPQSGMLPQSYHILNVSEGIFNIYIYLHIHLSAIGLLSSWELFIDAYVVVNNLTLESSTHKGETCWLIVVERDSNAPFSIATSPRSRGVATLFLNKLIVFICHPEVFPSYYPHTYMVLCITL